MEWGRGEWDGGEQYQDHTVGLGTHLQGLLRTIYTWFLGEVFCMFYINTSLKKEKEREIKIQRTI